MSKRVTDEELREVEREYTARGKEMLATGLLSPYTREHLLTRAFDLFPRLARELRTLREPVDVAGEMARLVERYRGGLILFGVNMHMMGLDDLDLTDRAAELRAAVRPHIERAATLAREAEGLRAEVAAAHVVLDKAGAFTHTIGVGAPNTTPATLAERIGDVVAELAGTANDLRASLDDLTTARAEIERLEKERRSIR